MAELYNLFCSRLADTELSQSDLGSQQLFDLNAILVRRFLVTIGDTGSGQPLVWSLYSDKDEAWIPDSAWAQTDLLQESIAGRGLPWENLTVRTPSFDWDTLPRAGTDSRQVEFSPPANRLTLEPWDDASKRWLDLIGQTMIRYWVDPAIDDASFYLANQLGIVSTLSASEQGELNDRYISYLQTAAFGMLENVGDIEGEYCETDKLALSVVSDGTLLTTPVGASWNFYGELTDSTEGWITRFSRYQNEPPSTV